MPVPFRNFLENTTVFSLFTSLSVDAQVDILLCRTHQRAIAAASKHVGPDDAQHIADLMFAN